jgi:hypothetical protein
MNNSDDAYIAEDAENEFAHPKLFARCLYRFGVLLALDNAEHSLRPNLPLADAYEQNIAQHIKT